MNRNLYIPQVPFFFCFRFPNEVEKRLPILHSIASVPKRYLKRWLQSVCKELRRPFECLGNPFLSEGLGKRFRGVACVLE